MTGGSLVGVLIVIGLYLFFMVSIGFRFSKNTDTVEGFYLGGRKLGPLVTAMSAEASDMSSWLLMGLPGVAYLTGCAEAVWTAVGLALGTYLNWLFVAKRLRRYSEKCNNSITIPDFFSNRYRDDSHLLMGLSALIILVFFVPYTASGFAACGKLFSTLFGAPYVPAMLLSAAIIVSYTALGGYLAASTTDLVQSIVMSIAIVVVVFFGISVAGGLDAVIANASQYEGYLSITSIFNPETGGSDPYSALTIASLLGWGLGYFGMPHILLRFMGIEDENKIVLSRRIATTWVIIAMAAAIFIGIIGNAMTAAGAVEYLETSGQAETLLVKIAQLLSNYGFLAIICGGLILAGILACTMSTSDSQLLAASSSFSQNLLQDCFKVKLSQGASMVAARVTVLVIAVISVFIASDPDSSVFRIVSFAWAGFGATFAPVMLFSLFWKRSNKYGALAGLIVGGISVFAWKFLLAPLGGIWAIYELMPAFVLASIAIVVVSLVTPPPSQEIVDEFESI